MQLIPALNLNNTARLVINTTDLVTNRRPVDSATTPAGSVPDATGCQCPLNTTVSGISSPKDVGDYDFEDEDFPTPMTDGGNSTNCSVLALGQPTGEPGLVLSAWIAFKFALGELEVVLIDAFDHPVVVVVFFSLLFTMAFVLIMAIVCHTKPVIILARKIQDDTSFAAEVSDEPVTDPGGRVSDEPVVDQDSPNPPDLAGSSIAPAHQDSQDDLGDTRANPDSVIFSRGGSPPSHSSHTSQSSRTPSDISLRLPVTPPASAGSASTPNSIPSSRETSPFPVTTTSTCGFMETSL